MRWTVIAHPDQYIKGCLVQTPKCISEEAVPAAVAQGWMVLARDTGIYDDRMLKALAPIDVPLHSNPRRQKHRDDATEQEDGT